MAFADLKNDLVFWRIFAKHPDIYRGLLNDLLDRQGDQVIEDIEYLPVGTPALVAGAKRSILDVRCRDRSGTTFVVNMQLLHFRVFLDRGVYEACNAKVEQRSVGEPNKEPADVVAISICEDVLWPDDAQDAQNLPRVPMLSRWNMVERGSGNHGPLQVQYVFLELPKLPKRRPETGADLWAWLFVHAPELTEVPSDLPAGPYRAAVELTNDATFTSIERNAYWRVIDEIRLTRAYFDGKRAEGFAEGFAEGKAAALTRGEMAGRAAAVLTVLAARGIAVSDEIRARITGCTDVATLGRWLVRAATAASAEEVVAGAP